MTFLVNGVNLRTRYFGKSQFTPTGQLYVWGNNNSSALGNNSTTNQFSPVQLGTNLWKQVSGGRYFSIGIQSNGTLWTWGSDGYGQLGINTTTNTSSPTQVGNNLWSQIGAGGYHSLAIQSNGTLWAWGYNGTVN